MKLVIGPLPLGPLGAWSGSHTAVGAAGAMGWGSSLAFCWELLASNPPRRAQVNGVEVKHLRDSVKRISISVHREVRGPLDVDTCFYSKLLMLLVRKAEVRTCLLHGFSMSPNMSCYGIPWFELGGSPTDQKQRCTAKGWYISRAGLRILHRGHAWLAIGASNKGVTAVVAAAELP